MNDDDYHCCKWFRMHLTRIKQWWVEQKTIMKQRRYDLHEYRQMQKEEHTSLRKWRHKQKKLNMHYRRGWRKEWKRGRRRVWKKECHTPQSHLNKDHTIEHVVGFLGNPNVGKTSLFNELTGSHQHTGNWPGKTVEKKEGHFILADEYFSLVDLPGTYSLNARSDEELVTEHFIVEEKPDLVCVIVDATRLERTMYLALQAMELTKNVALIVNMMDIAEKEGLEIDRKKLEDQLGIPVLLVSAKRTRSYIDLRKFIYDSLHTDKYSFTPAKIVYPNRIERMIHSITQQIKDRTVLKEYPTRWLALKILEKETWVVEKLDEEYDLSDVYTKLQSLSETKDFDPGIEISKVKYAGIHNIVYTSVTGCSDFKESKSDRVDKIILHPFWGYPIMIVIYALFFLVAFYASTPIINGLDYLINLVSITVRNYMESIGNPEIVISLVVDGVIAGIGALLLFLPLILVFYALVAIMEDSGYLARSAYLMDNMMAKFGLQGTAFLSIVMGFGCNVAGVLATRIMKNPKNRLRMIVSLSFIPCAATLGVVAFITGIFFKPWAAALLMLAFYALSILLTLFSALFLGLFMKKEEPIPLIMEIPEYRRPRLKNIYHLTWTRAGIFIKKAGTFIFLASLFIWFVTNVPFNAPPEKTILGYVGRGIAFITEPLFGLDWKMIAPLIFGIAAKESIISALGIIYAANGTLKTTLLALWTIPQTIAFLFFQLTYAPCFGTIAAIRSETKSWKLTLFGIFYPLVITTIITTLIYQILNVIF